MNHRPQKQHLRKEAHRILPVALLAFSALPAWAGAPVLSRGCQVQVDAIEARGGRDGATAIPDIDCTAELYVAADDRSIRRAMAEDTVIFANGKLLVNLGGQHAVAPGAAPGTKPTNGTRYSFWGGSNTGLQDVRAIAYDSAHHEIAVLDDSSVRFFPKDFDGNLIPTRWFSDAMLRNAISIAVDPVHDQVLVLTNVPSILFFSRQETDQNRQAQQRPPLKPLATLGTSAGLGNAVDLVALPDRDELAVLEYGNLIRIYALSAPSTELSHEKASVQIQLPEKACRPTSIHDIGMQLLVTCSNGLNYLVDRKAIPSSGQRSIAASTLQAANLDSTGMKEGSLRLSARRAQALDRRLAAEKPLNVPAPEDLAPPPPVEKPKPGNTAAAN